MSAAPHQLVLPLAGVSAPPTSDHAIPRVDRVFVNRNLRMSSIDWVGFDMDYTLAIYGQAEMDALSVERRSSADPARLPALPAEAARTTRAFRSAACSSTSATATSSKMDRYKVVHKGYHGLRELPKEELSALYHHKRIRPHTPRYHWIDTLFALSEVTSYAAIVDAHGEAQGDAVDYDKLFTDIRECIDEAHADGTVYSVVTSDLAALRRARSRARAHAAQAALRRQEAVPADELAVGLHREDDDATCSAARCPSTRVAALLRVS